MRHWDQRNIIRNPSYTFYSFILFFSYSFRQTLSPSWIILCNSLDFYWFNKRVFLKSVSHIYYLLLWYFEIQQMSSLWLGKRDHLKYSLSSDIWQALTLHLHFQCGLLPHGIRFSYGCHELPSSWYIVLFPCMLFV